MINARPDRRILVYRSRVVPFEQSISPLLLVNYESRKCAKAFYNVKLDIYSVPPVSQDQIEDTDKDEYWNEMNAKIQRDENGIQGSIDARVETPFNRHFHDFDCVALAAIEVGKRNLKEIRSQMVSLRLSHFGSSSVSQAEASGPPKGAFYISPEHDVFITDYDCGMHFCIDIAPIILGADFPIFQEIACHHVSAKLSADTCRRVSTLVLARVPHFLRGLDPLAPWDWHIDAFWRKQIFPSARAHFVLR